MESLFNKLHYLLMLFIRVFQQHCPLVYDTLEAQAPAVMFECTKVFTVAERSLKQGGFYNLFAVEKQAKRVRFYKSGSAVEKDDHYDLVLYDILQEDGKRYSTKRFQNFDAVVEFEMSEQPFDIADKVNMLGLQLHQKDTGRKFDITLHDNFFVEGNILFDRPMVRYFLKEFHNTSILDLDEYDITFIDQEMNVRSLTQNEHILISEGAFVIIADKNQFKHCDGGISI